MSDRPNDTLVLTDSPPAHRMLIERPAQQRGLWLIAALLAAMDTLLLLVLIGG